MDVLAAGMEIAAQLREGLASPHAGAAARRLRRLLDADAIGLVDLHGTAVWSGDRDARAPGLVDEALGGDHRARRPGLLALPLRARDELAGALVVAGPVRVNAARQAAAWVGEALERGRLEASAGTAEQAELRALRAEISPHFVYNTLTTIASFVGSDPERARDLLLDFAEYIRHNLARHGDYTTLAGEFRAIEAYLTLARAVLGERLRVQVRIAPEVLPVAVPFLALQPLVENAVQHGVERSESGGSVQVSGEAQGSECVISVEDDGPGMDPAHARAILAGQAAGSSLGLVNVDRRLRTVFGAGYGLVIETAEGAGTRVVMRVPRFHPGVVAS
ncbi:histidine kinase [Pseudonocardia sp. K10HN5]|uniref:histidine kinase n=2 Tax=Pseudonocardia acidicola TaxID=2724939 RepID=A0ABX1S6D5_9PSEU|nr:histidine kinase [Pseudonocardia acidicola]NMH97133.1 histidine kinase [Pseudonocardia acidicola]